jgi:hypothetical protein
MLFSRSQAEDAKTSWQALETRFNNVLNDRVRPASSPRLPELEQSTKSDEILVRKLERFFDELPDGADDRPMLYAGRFLKFSRTLPHEFRQLIEWYHQQGRYLTQKVSCDKCRAVWPAGSSQCEKCDWHYDDVAIEVGEVTWKKFFLSPFDSHHNVVLKCFDDVISAASAEDDAPLVSLSRTIPREEGPHWIESQRKLYLHGREIHHFKKSAAVNQIEILRRFEDECWPESIESPLRDSKTTGDTLDYMQKKWAKQQGLAFSRAGDGRSISLNWPAKKRQKKS